MNIFTHMLSSRIGGNNLKLHIFTFYGGMLHCMYDAGGGQDIELTLRFGQRARVHFPRCR